MKQALITPLFKSYKSGIHFLFLFSLSDNTVDVQSNSNRASTWFCSSGRVLRSLSPLIILRAPPSFLNNISRLSVCSLEILITALTLVWLYRSPWLFPCRLLTSLPGTWHISWWRETCRILQHKSDFTHSTGRKLNGKSLTKTKHTKLMFYPGLVQCFLLLM